MTRTLRPVASRSVGSGSPIGISSLGLAFGLGAAGAAALAAWPLAVATWLINRTLDGLDGVIARDRHATSDRGAFIDMAFDVIVYSTVPLGVAIGSDVDGVWVATALLLASFYLNITSVLYLSALLERRGRGAAQRGETTSITMPSGLVEGTETVVWFTLILAIPSGVLWLMGSMAVAVGVSALLRFWQGWTMLEPQ